MLFNFLCNHNWRSHSKEKKRTETYARNIIGDNYNPTGIVHVFTKEVLICEKCGKVKIIKY